jgi:hypothetical protein
MSRAIQKQYIETVKGWHWISKHLVWQPIFNIIISCFTVVVLFIPVGPFMGTTHSEGHTIPVCDDSVTK